MARIFSIRIAGVAFDSLDRVATPKTTLAARKQIAAQNEFSQAKQNAKRFVRSDSQSDNHVLPPEQLQAWRQAIRDNRMPSTLESTNTDLIAFQQAARNLADCQSLLQQTLRSEIERSRAALSEVSRNILPSYLVFGADRIQQLLHMLIGAEPQGISPPSRNKRIREREHRVLLYLQRICGKNDTFSEFGPSVWGSVSSDIEGISLNLESCSIKRDSYLERWVANVIATALNLDPAVREDLAPRVNPTGRIESKKFVFADTGKAIPLDSFLVDVLGRCDGVAPANQLGVPMEILTDLADRRILRWEVEVPALQPRPVDVLAADVASWQNAKTRARWLPRLQTLVETANKFAETSDAPSRLALMNEARCRINDFGFTRSAPQRFLYTAANPIAEECLRDCQFIIGQSTADALVDTIEPWIDLWRDCYAFVASRVAAGLFGLFRSAPLHDGALALPSFLRHCEAQKISLTGHGIVGLAYLGFKELKSAFATATKTGVDTAEWSLKSADCHFVRRNFEYPKFDEYTYPSADLQISASSWEAIKQDEFEWVLGELHPPIALLHHAIYWSCPDKAELGSELAITTCGRPNFYYGFFAADFSAHTTVRQMDAIPELTNFVAPLRGRPEWRMIPPSETEVYVDESTGDVCLRRRGSHEYLGSFARNWIIPLGFHPFSFSLGRHTPRLRCGKVIVQRQAWTVTLEEMGTGNFTGISRDLVIAVERLRAARDLPRYVYIRPTEQALRRSGAEGRDKDTKPVFIDLESYLFLEIFYRWLVKAGEIEVTEMLPDPDHLLWKEPDGRRTFELRTLIVPRE